MPILRIPDGKGGYSEVPALVGPAGKDGKDGAQGLKGDKGDKGDTGAPGKDGGLSPHNHAIADVTGLQPALSNAIVGLEEWVPIAVTLTSGKVVEVLAPARPEPQYPQVAPSSAGPNGDGKKLQVAYWTTSLSGYTDGARINMDVPGADTDPIKTATVGASRIYVVRADGSKSMTSITTDADQRGYVTDVGLTYDWRGAYLTTVRGVPTGSDTVTKSLLPTPDLGGAANIVVCKTGEWPSRPYTPSTVLWIGDQYGHYPYEQEEDDILFYRGSLFVAKNGSWYDLAKRP